METIFMNTENTKTNKPHKFVLNLSQRLYLRCSNCFLKFIYLLHVEKYKKTAKEQNT